MDRKARRSVNLCQPCWDRFQEQQGGGAASSSSGGSSAAGGPPLHDRAHAFQHIGPRMSRHNDYYSNRDGGSDGSGADPGNPWGNRPPGGGSLGRALQRLGERYGIREWH